MEEFNKALEELITSIKITKEYQNCVSLREKMKQSPEILTLIEKVKTCQKKVVQSQYDDSFTNELKEVQEELEKIPIYQIYLQNLEVVNEKIETVKDHLNQYFDELLNKKY